MDCSRHYIRNTTQNFKSHKETCLHLDDSRLHALVGKNSSGKTSILQSIDYLGRLAHSSLQSVFSNPTILDSCVRSGCVDLIFGARYSDLSNKKYYEFLCQLEKVREESRWRSRIEHVEVSSKYLETQEKPFSRIPSGSQDLMNNWRESLQKFGIAIQYPTYLKLHIQNLTRPDYSSNLHPRMQPDGSGIASGLGNLRDESQEHFECLQDMMRRVVPGVQKVRIRRAEVVVKSLPYDDQGFERLLTKTTTPNHNDESKMRRKVISEVFDTICPKVIGQGIALDMTSGQSIPAHSLSEGTLLTLGILTAVISPQRSNLILLEDIQQGLHPRAQREIISILKEVLQNNSELQIIFSTHSPYILDALEPSQVHVLSTAKTGFTQTKRLDEHPDSEWAKQTLTTGEFWDSTGEDWVAEA